MMDISKLHYHFGPDPTIFQKLDPDKTITPGSGSATLVFEDHVFTNCKAKSDLCGAT